MPMRVVLFDTHAFERAPLAEANGPFHHELTFLEARLTAQTAPLANGFPCVCAFANEETPKTKAPSQIRLQIDLDIDTKKTPLTCIQKLA